MFPRVRRGEKGPWALLDLPPGEIQATKEATRSLVPLVGRLRSGWFYVMRLVLHEGRWVVRDLQVFPEPDDWLELLNSGGALLSEWINLPTPLPLGGLTARDIRRIPFAARSARTALRRFATATQGVASEYARAARGDRRVAVIAQRYVEALHAGSRTPNADVARDLRFEVSEVRDAIHRARVLRFLSSTRRQGVMGGKLTARALAILNQPIPNDEEKRAYTELKRRARARARRRIRHKK